MRTWLSEVRIGIVAGVTAGAVLWAANRITDDRTSPGVAPSDHVFSANWTPPLVDPIAAATDALTRGDSALVAIAEADSLLFPGVSAQNRLRTETEPIHLYSPRSTGLAGSAWASFAARAIPYAAAYNAVIQVARRTPTRGL